MVLTAAVFGCGGSGSSGQGGDESGGRGAGDGSERRQKADFALAKLACGELPKADFAVDSVGLPADSGDRAIAKAYAAEWPPGDREAAFAGCLKGLEKVPDRFPPSSPSARDIWGRNFLVTSIASNRGEQDLPVVEPYRARLWFGSERGHSMSWQARCNSIAADVRFTARRMEAETTVSSLIGCPAGPGREDAWLSRFMESNPEWRLEGESLRLASGLATMELRGYAEPGKCPVFPDGGWVDAGDSGYDCEGALRFLALEEIGKDGYLRGWRCRESVGGDGQVRTDCRQRDSRLAFGGFDPTAPGR